MSETTSLGRALAPVDTFVRRHIGPSDADIARMLAVVGAPSLEALLNDTIPDTIRLKKPIRLADLPESAELGENEVLARLREIAAENRVLRSFIGMGYHDCIVPPVILRNILEDPGWYTQYTPYQAEISQGRLEALLNFQTMVADLTGLPIANASLLDEATAAAEAMSMCVAISRRKDPCFFISNRCHPQTIAVVRTRAALVGIRVEVGDPATVDWQAGDYAGVLLQYPATDGAILDHAPTVAAVHAARAQVVMAVDLLALTLLRTPGELGADIAVGSSQRFGVPMGFGGPHAGFLATTHAHKRQMPGRIIGVSKDSRGKPAYRMALQTREQHIRREKATSNICTAQALLAIMAAMYGTYHGPEGLIAIAQRIHALTLCLAEGLQRLGARLGDHPVFDTLRVTVADASSADAVVERAAQAGMNLRRLADDTVGIALDEPTTIDEVQTLLQVFAGAPTAAGAQAGDALPFTMHDLAASVGDAPRLPPEHLRKTPFMQHPVWTSYRGEHEMLRYINRLRSRDLSLAQAMIPLGSCTMKLNATTEMLPVSWPGFAGMHPFAPADQARGYTKLIDSLADWLCELTGFSAASLQPNAGAQGEYAGLAVIRAYLRDRGEDARRICLIPVSAHGTNPASAVMAGMRVVPVACDERGNIDLADLRAKAERHGAELAALMVTYPSTHGVFEEGIVEVCRIVHEHGGQVYLDGANMNAQVGQCRPGDYGADVCHLNLHKTFAIPHGGGGPGVGPICVASHLAPYLPDSPLAAVGGEKSMGAVSAAPWGSAGILPISWAYIALMGSAGLGRATAVAILNANYMAARLKDAYQILYAGNAGRVAHEFIIDLRPLKAAAGIEAEDVAKRLIDYGFHAPTMSFPVPGTLMIEPTESESRAELDRLCDALIAIREEIRAVEEGRLDRNDNPLKNAPHTADRVSANHWPHTYDRETAAYPAPWLHTYKFWPFVGRVDNVWGDRNLMCTCPPIESYSDG